MDNLGVASKLASVSLILIICGSALSSCGVNEDDYVRENEKLLEGVAAYPGSTLRETQDTPYSDGDNGIGGPDGYVTRTVWNIAGPVQPDDILQHYESQLGPEWVQIRDAGCFSGCPSLDEGPTARFERGSARIYLNFDSIGAGSYELALDHDS